MFLSDAYQESYETTQVSYQKVRLRVQAVQEEISMKNRQLVFNAVQLYNSRFSEVVATDLSLEQER